MRPDYLALSALIITVVLLIWNFSETSNSYYLSYRIRKTIENTLKAWGLILIVMSLFVAFMLFLIGIGAVE